MREYIISFIVIFFITASSKAEEKKRFSLVGPGGMTCREYIAIIDENKKAEAAWTFFWVQGYMTGVNLSVMTAAKEKNVGANLNAMDTEEQELFLRIYCRKNSNDKVYQAADSLMLRLDHE